ALAEARDVARRHGSRRDRRGAMQQDPVRRSLTRDAAAKTTQAPKTADKQQRLPFFSTDSAEPSDDTAEDRQAGRT
ncbi:MAG: hypothetical protein ACKOTB_06915, partial [Planctomycetia bacterium]